MKLLIAEKPSVAFAIAKALDISGKKDGYIEKDKYVISWCVGHLVSLAEPQAYESVRDEFARINAEQTEVKVIKSVIKSLSA